MSYKVPGETPDTATQTVTRQADGSYLITGNGLLQSVTDTVTSGTSTITNRTNLRTSQFPRYGVTMTMPTERDRYRHR
ncbi:hypothetical protein ACI3EW_14900 [Pilosibacter sp. HC1M1C21]|uniref:hypothetical protein n=1 Tax=Pilosibacter sp. HC1M1C21 TaxID=3378803 RepID=UPI0038592DFE